jgi:enoyl-CoA hydratase/carnithine racemase
VRRDFQRRASGARHDFAAPKVSVVELARSGQVLHAVLNRPEKRNAINGEMRDALLDVLEMAALDETVAGIVFSGAGRGFCAGADLSEFTVRPVLSETKESRRRRDLFGKLALTPVISVAILHGFALGSGLELALLCDLRSAARGTRVGLPEATLGMMPPAGGTQTLPRLVGVGRALSLALLARPITVEAVQLKGVVDEIVDDVDASVATWIAQLDRYPAYLLRQLKRSLQVHPGQPEGLFV